MNIRFLLFAGLIILLSSCSSNRKYGSMSSRYTNERIKTGKYSNKPNLDQKGAKDVQIIKSSTNKSSSEASTLPDYGRKVQSSDEIRSEIIDIATQLIGVKYKPAGRLPDKGFDCSGFVNYVMAEANIRVHGPSPTLSKQGKLKNRKSLEKGDLVFFGNKKRISHVGIVVSNDENGIEIIHSSSRYGVRKDKITGSEYWDHRFLFGRDVISLEN